MGKAVICHLSMSSKTVAQTREETLLLVSIELPVSTKHSVAPHIEDLPLNLGHGQLLAPSSSNSGNLILMYLLLFVKEL